MFTYSTPPTIKCPVCGFEFENELIDPFEAEGKRVHCPVSHCNTIIECHEVEIQIDWTWAKASD